MNGLNKARAEALALLLNMQIKNKMEVKLSAYPINDRDEYFVATEQQKIRIFKGEGFDLYKIHIGGTLRVPRVIIKGHTYDGIAKLFDSIEEIN